MDKWGIALFTLRDELAKDFKGTLAKVKEIGYAGVEFAGFGDHSASEIKAMLEEVGLEAWSSHVPLAQLRESLDDVLAYHKEVGVHYIVCPYLTPEERQAKDDYLELAKDLETIGNACKEAGIGFCYHNHDFELQTFDGEYALDLLLSQTTEEHVQLECDAYWVEFAGVDAKRYMNQYTGRVPMVHLKDMKATDKSFAEVGEGTLDIKGIIQAGKEAGARYFFVEQDICERSPLESISISFNNIQRLS